MHSLYFSPSHHPSSLLGQIQSDGVRAFLAAFQAQFPSQEAAAAAAAPVGSMDVEASGTSDNPSTPAVSTVTPVGDGSEEQGGAEGSAGSDEGAAGNGTNMEE